MTPVSVVHRYEIPGHDSIVSMPDGAKVLHVAFQNRAPYALCVWALIDPQEPWAVEHFIVTPTGGEVPDGARHLGTVQDHGGLVFHVWVGADSKDSA